MLGRRSSPLTARFGRFCSPRGLFDLQVCYVFREKRFCKVPKIYLMLLSQPWYKNKKAGLQANLESRFLDVY